VGDALGGGLAVGGADLRRDLGLHQLAAQPRHRLAHDIAVLVVHQLADQLVGGHSVVLGHRGVFSFVDLLERTDDSDPRWPTYVLRSAPTGVTPLLAT